MLKRGNFTYFCLSIFECYDTGNTIKRKRQTFISAFGASSNGSDVIRANNNYPFKTSEDFVWYIAIDNKDVIGFIPVEQKSGKKAVINNYYVAAVDEKRKEILSLLLSSVVTAFIPAGWTLNSVTLIQDQETFEKFEFASMDKKWTRYVKMNR